MAIPGGHELIWTGGLFAALFALLWLRRPADRSTLYGTLAILLLALVAQLLAAAAQRLAFGTVDDVLRETAIIAAGIALIRVTGMAVFRIFLPAVRVAPPRILEDVVVVLAYIAWGMVRLRYAGMDFSGIVTTSAVITAIIAFSMQDTLGNILGGVALQLDDSIQVGQWVKYEDVVGRVVDIRWRSTAVETRNGETVMIPNALLMKNRFQVLGKRQEGPLQWRRWVRFELSQEVTPTEVIRSVQNALRQAEIANVSRAPAPDCVLMGFDNGNCQYAVRYWLTDLQPDDPTDSEVRRHVFAALRRGGLFVALPQMRIHAHTEGDDAGESLSRRERDHRLASLRSVDIFARLTHEELCTLADRLQYAPFAAGDVMTRQGALSHWLYVITLGEVQVLLELPDNSRRELRRLRAGQFFGEMGLMTGSPRNATVVAVTDVESYRLDQQAFRDILLARPEIAEDISQVLSSRQAERDLLLQEVDAEERTRRMASEHSALLTRIRSFFGLAGS